MALALRQDFGGGGRGWQDFGGNTRPRCLFAFNWLWLVSCECFYGETLSTTAAALKELSEQPKKIRRFDLPMLAGVAIAALAMLSGIAATGVRLTYFLQPTGLLIVFGGSLGVMFITTPRASLVNTAQRVKKLVWSPDPDDRALLEEIMSFVKQVRVGGLLNIEPMIEGVRHEFLKEALLLALDVQQRAELEDALHSKLRIRERQGESDAKVLEVAGGFAPTIGVLGTVVGLIDVLRQFSNLTSVASGIGTAFVSTIYGLVLANVILLPAAFRIRARVAEAYDTHEMIMEGVLCLFDRVHPSLVRERLTTFLRAA